MLCCSYGVLLERVASFRNLVCFTEWCVSVPEAEGRYSPEGSRGALTAERSPLASSLHSGLQNVPRTIHVLVQDTGSLGLLSCYILWPQSWSFPVWKE